MDDIAISRLVFVAACTCVLCACTDPPTAERALDDLGFTEIQTTGYRFFSCGEDYTFHTGFAATNVNGKRVTGAVCSGWLKGTSVKFD